MKSTIILIDDHPLIREGIKALLKADGSYSVCGEASSPEEVEPLLSSRRVNIAVLDLIFNDKPEGFSILSNILSYNKDIKVLILSMLDDPVYINRAMADGASGYLLKGDVSDMLIPALKSIYSGKPFFSPSSRHRYIDDDLHSLLSNREMEVFHLLGEGRTVREIGNYMNIASSTVGSHIEKIKKRINASSVNELIRLSVLYKEIGRIG